MKIQCPKCAFSREVDAEKIPEKAKLATCPKCGHKFHFRESESIVDLEAERIEPRESADDLNDQEDIWAKLESLDPAEEEQKSSSFSGRGDAKSGSQNPVPWEDLQSHGLIQGFWLTLKQVMVAPIDFFRSMPLGTSFTQPLVFYLVVAEIQVLARFFWGLTGFIPQVNADGSMLGMGLLGSGSVVLLFLYPVLMTFMLFFASGLNHLCLQAVKSGEGGFIGTFKVVAYANGPMVLAVFPMIGPLAGMIWAVVCTFLGFKIVHATNGMRVLAAMLLPVLLLLVISSVVFVVNGISGVW